jgi:uncharacterized membrane protein YgcG
MQTLMWVMFALAMIIFPIGVALAIRRKQRRDAHTAEILAESERQRRAKEAEPFVPGRAPYIRPQRSAIHTRSARYNAPTPTVVQQQSSGMDPLMAGAIGYMIGSSGSSHHSRDDCPAPVSSGGGEYGGAGASSSWDDSSSSSSSSSDSGSSYDSGSSSSDSGSSSSGSSSD